MTLSTTHKAVAKDKMIADELSRLGSKGDGILYPEDVVRAAKPVNSPLHTYFDWEDGLAAWKWRLEQARRLIRVYITVIEADGPKESRAYVSLSSDRQGDGGYRAIVDVLENEEMREQLLADALGDLRRLKTKYASLQELASVFAAIDAIKVRRT